MSDIKKVLKGLYFCAKQERPHCTEECPYYGHDRSCSSIDLKRDAEELIWDYKIHLENDEHKREENGRLKDSPLIDAAKDISNITKNINCKECRYGLYNGMEYLCDKHSGHEDRLGEDQYYKEWHNGNWFCADGERKDTEV